MTLIDKKNRKEYKKMNTKQINYYEKFELTQAFRRSIDNLKDPIPLLTLDYNGIPGVYMFSAIGGNGKEITMYIGESNDLALRLRQHWHRWWANGKLTYHTGLPDNGQWHLDHKIRIDILEGNNDMIDVQNRIKKEREYILLHKPYLQSPKYPKYNDKLLDCCIVPFNGTRSKAFQDALEGKAWE